MWTRDPERLSQRLVARFGNRNKNLRPVYVTKAYDFGFVGYQNKAIKLPDLLRRSRRVLPELLLALDKTEFLELMVLKKCRLSVSDGHLRLKAIEKK